MKVLTVRKADLHGSTLAHATSLRQACDMTLIFQSRLQSTSTILTQENLPFLPYSVEIFLKIRNFLLISATLVAGF